MKTKPSKSEMIEILLNKGVADILPNKNFVEKILEKNKKLTIYAGFDPTAPTLHIGHTIQLRKLKHFQDLGHKIIFLIGDFTARIGDPTDKSATRKQLTEKEIKTNLRLYKKQASKFIDFTGKNAASVKFNSSWLSKMKFEDVLNLSSLITVDQMLKRDMFVRRAEEEKPIYIHEFMYPLMQGYDSVAMNVDGEVGGNDQLFNMLMGRTLQKQLSDKDKFVITTKLLEDGTGAKMGKTTGNMISLLDSPSDMYGKVMSWPDSLITLGFELCTDYSILQTKNIQDELNKGINPRDLKMKLSFEIVKNSYSDNEAIIAEESFVSTFQQKEIPLNILEIINTRSLSLAEILIEKKLVYSNSELRRLANDRAIKNLETENTLSFEEIRIEPQKGTYKIGKNRFIRIL